MSKSARLRHLMQQLPGEALGADHDLAEAGAGEAAAVGVEVSGAVLGEEAVLKLLDEQVALQDVLEIGRRQKRSAARCSSAAVTDRPAWRARRRPSSSAAASSSGSRRPRWCRRRSSCGPVSEAPPALTGDGACGQSSQLEN
jgi:hypothetical protein